MHLKTQSTIMRIADFIRFLWLGEGRMDPPNNGYSHLDCGGGLVCLPHVHPCLQIEGR